MKTIWDGTTSLRAYREALEILRNHIPTNYLIREIPQILSQIHRPKLILRHDVHHSLEKAAAMARLEYSLGLRASYMLDTGSPSVRMDQPRTLEHIKKIQEMGHEIGLCMPAPSDRSEWHGLIPVIQAESARLRRRLGFPLYSVSLSAAPMNPPDDSLFIGTAVNADAPLLTRWCLSDRDATWEFERPRPAEEDPDRALLQIVVRPEVWDDEETPSEMRPGDSGGR
jgi:hypothetical protein